MLLKKTLAYIFIFVVLFRLQAQEIVSLTEHHLTWTPISLLADKNMFDFKNAVRPDESLTPYFTTRFQADPAYNYQVVVENEVLLPLSPAELTIASQFNTPQATILVSSSIQKQQANSFLEVLVNPFVVRNGITYKLQSFSLKQTKQAQAKKINALNKHSYAANSVLATGRFVKIAVVNTGVYRLTYEDLNAMGVSPANVRIFGYGGEVLEQDFSKPMLDDLPEVAIHMEKGADNVFNAGDYILFYAKGIQKWTYSNSQKIFTHTINSYSTKGYYFVTSDAGVGRKIETVTVETPADATVIPVEEFIDYAVHEKELYSLGQSGKEFYGEKFGINNSNNYVFDFPNVVKSNSTKVRIDVATISTDNSSFSLSLDNQQTQNLFVSKSSNDTYEVGIGASTTFNYTPTRDALNFKLVYNLANSASTGYLNYIEVNTQRDLTMSGAFMPFRYVGALGSSNYCMYKLANASANVQVWDVTDAPNINALKTQIVDSKLSFTAPGAVLRQYVAVDPSQASAFPKPETIGVVTNQNLHALPQAEMVIITHPDFVPQAQELAQAHNVMDGLRVNILTTDQIYNEFSSGTPDATAYRRAVKMFYDRALSSGVNADLPKYLLLFGRGTFDNRKLLNSSGDNYVMTYQADNSLLLTSSYVTDDYFGFLDDSEGNYIPSHLVDVGIGRFPVSNAQQASDVVKKTIAYMQNTNKGKWKNQLCFLADDGDHSLHMSQADDITDIIAANYKSYQLNKIYLDAYKQEISASGESYPIARKKLHDLINKGLFYLNYTGHAGTMGWTNENMMQYNDVLTLENKVLPIWVGATCNFLQFDIKPVSAGEQVLLNPLGGGIGLLSAARPVYAWQNFYVNRYFADNLFKKSNGKHLRVGDAVALAKNSVGTEINKLSYVYLGDPALKLNYPTDYVVQTTAITSATGVPTDTISAMSVVKVTAQIEDDNKQKVSSFNGSVYIDVYDKLQTITTQNNHNEGSMTFMDRPNILFSGKATVVDGEFSFTFMLPKDIKYNYGGGRINYYATGNDSTEAQGYYEDFTVGGTSENVVYETDGPEIEMYLNTPNFKNGDKVNESPMFVAKIQDQSGINKVGSGIGHDLLITIDNDLSLSKVVNDFFETNENSYSSGAVNYKLAGLEEGKHTLTFKAWDLLNNSSTKTIEFEVVKGLTPVIFKAYNYPNPVVTTTNIVVEHDRPETVLFTKVEIFDLSGRKIWEFSQNNADAIVWDRIGFDGLKVKAGMYLYKVSVNTSSSDVYSKSNKMLIVGQ